MFIALQGSKVSSQYLEQVTFKLKPGVVAVGQGGSLTDCGSWRERLWVAFITKVSNHYQRFISHFITKV